jgi:hypothetical protein
MEEIVIREEQTEKHRKRESEKKGIVKNRYVE